MTELDLSDDDGFMRVKFPGGVVTVDVWQARGRLAALWRQFEGRTEAEFFPVLMDYLQELGFPSGLSYHVGERFAKAIFRRAKEMGEGSGSGAGSPDPTPEPTRPG